MLYDNTVFISQPMKNKTNDEIVATRKKAVENILNMGLHCINEVFYLFKEDERLPQWKQPVLSLSFSITLLANCDYIYMCKGWEDVRGCKIEHEIAKQCGIKIIYEE